MPVPEHFRLHAAHLRLPPPSRPLQNDACCQYPQLAYSLPLKATFVELPAFERLRPDYLSDEEFAVLQQSLMARPDAGDVMPGAGGLRKLRFANARRRKGTRGGLRVVYFHWLAGRQFWLFTLYDKHEVSDLTAAQRRAFKKVLEAEVEARRLDG
jgi:hypothetical protein